MTTKKILIVGHGSIGKRHLRMARTQCPQAQIGVLRHKKTAIVPAHATHVFSTMAEALAFEPNLAVIASPATHHLSGAMALAMAGVHLLIEKPLSDTAAGAAELLAVCQNRNLCLATGYNLRFLPSLQKFKSMLEEKVIGDVWSVRCEAGQYLPAWRPDGDYREGVSARDELGGGALLELSHELDYLAWIFGEVDWVQAVLTRQSDLEIDVEDSAHLILGFCAEERLNPLVATVNLDFVRQDSTRNCTAIGKLGSLRWNGVAGTVELWSSGSQAWQKVYRYEHTRDQSYVAEWQDFLGCIEAGNPPFVGGTDGLKALRIVDAARLAAKRGGRMQVGQRS